MKEKFKSELADLQFLWQFSLDDFKSKYAGAAGGAVWAVLQPFSTILLYWFVFQVGFNSPPVNGYPFILWLVSGLMPWFFISDAIAYATGSMVEYSYLVKKVRFNIDILPLVKVVSVFLVQAFLLVVLVAMFLVSGRLPDLYYLQLPLYIVYMFILVAGVAYLVATVYVFFKDISQLVSILLQICFWTTPIVYRLDTIPYPAVHQILQMTPLYYVVSGYRNVFIHKVWFFEQPLGLTLYYWAFALAILALGLTVFHRCKDHFADVL